MGKPPEPELQAVNSHTASAVLVVQPGKLSVAVKWR